MGIIRGEIRGSVELQIFAGGGVGLMEKAGVLGFFQIEVVGGDHRFHARAAFGGFENVRETMAHDFEHDVDADGSTGGSAQQGGNGFCGIGDDLGAVVHDAGFAIGFLDRCPACARCRRPRCAPGEGATTGPTCPMRSW